MKPRTKIKLESNIDTEKLKLAFEGATSAFSNLSISVNNFKQQQKLRRKQNFFFVLFWIIVFSVVAGIMNKVTAQTKIQINGIYSLDLNVYEKDPFAEEYAIKVKVLAIKNGYIQFKVLEHNNTDLYVSSSRLDTFIDALKSYNKKYKRPYKIYTKQKSQY